MLRFLFTDDGKLTAATSASRKQWDPNKTSVGVAVTEQPLKTRGRAIPNTDGHPIETIGPRLVPAMFVFREPRDAMGYGVLHPADAYRTIHRLQRWARF